MALISKIGPLELSLISFLGALFLYRIQAKPESRIATGLVFLCAAQFGASFINGFAISEATKLSFGELDTVFAYLMFAFALFEVLMLVRVTNWENTDVWALIGLFGLGFLNLSWKLISSFGLSANDFLYLILIILFLFLRPTQVDLRFLPYFGAVVILLVFICALVHYQNPLFPYRLVNYGLGSPYENRIWDFFGFEERFRGPYYHPNQLGMHVTFLSFLVLLKPTKFYVAILPISFIVLFLSSSRTSILALTIGLLSRAYFDWTRFDGAISSYIKPGLQYGHVQGRFRLRNLLLGFLVTFVAAVVVRQIIGNNVTGTGRLDNYRTTISSIQENFLLGKGPSLFSINSTENTLLTLLSFYGLLGFILLVTVTVALSLKFRSTTRNGKKFLRITLAIILVASTGEAVLTGEFGEVGVYYLLILLTLTREGYSLKERPQP